ncbi:MAG: hypothetical protein ACTSRU_19050, partial [Candidatus Hodarchaeales archaeon]
FVLGFTDEVVYFVNNLQQNKLARSTPRGLTLHSKSEVRLPTRYLFYLLYHCCPIKNWVERKNAINLTALDYCWIA